LRLSKNLESRRKRKRRRRRRRKEGRWRSKERAS
jgi:hypothetical protein